MGEGDAAGGADIITAIAMSWQFLGSVIFALAGGIWAVLRRRSNGDFTRSFLTDAGNSAACFLLSVLAVAAILKGIGISREVFANAVDSGGVILALALVYSAYLSGLSVYEAGRPSRQSSEAANHHNR